MNTTPLCLENDNNEYGDFNGQPITFTLQMIKVWTIKWAFKISESDSYCIGGKHRSATTKIYGTITSKANTVLIGYCSKCNRKKHDCYW